MAWVRVHVHVRDLRLHDPPEGVWLVRYGPEFSQVLRAFKVTWDTETRTVHHKKSAYLEVREPVIADGVEVYADGPRG